MPQTRGRIISGRDERFVVKKYEDYFSVFDKTLSLEVGWYTTPKSAMCARASFRKKYVDNFA